MDLIAHLEQRVESTKLKLHKATERLNEAMQERDTVKNDLEGYQRALDAERRANGINPVPVSEEQPVKGIDGEMSKAGFARQFVRSRAASGVTPMQIFQGFQDAGIKITKPYVYALVQRLRKQNAIRPKRGKWFPVALESDEQPVNGTGQTDLP